MISPKKLFNEFKKNKINFFIGVPDSVLKNFTNNIPEKQNFVTQNEGSAVAYLLDIIWTLTKQV